MKIIFEYELKMPFQPLWNVMLICFFVWIAKMKFWFILGLPYGAFIFSEDEKKKHAEKETKLAAKNPNIFKKDKGIFDDFANLTKKEMQELLFDHYQKNMNKWNSSSIVDEFWNHSHNFIGQSHLQCCTNILKNL